MVDQGIDVIVIVIDPAVGVGAVGVEIGIWIDAFVELRLSCVGLQVCFGSVLPDEGADAVDQDRLQGSGA